MSDNAVYDYFVVGVGSAGAVVASRLSESGAYRVLRREARCYKSEPDEGAGGRRIDVPMGCPDDSFPANSVRSDRGSNGDFVRYVGFAD